MNERFICISMESSCYGHWGTGDTLEKAKKALRKAGGKVKGCRVIRFTSDLPFAPVTKLKADETEADCWVGRDGSVNWVRCERV